MTGFTRKPAWLRALGWFLWLHVLGMPLQAMVWFGHPPWEWAALWAKIAPQNQLVMVCSATAALGVQRVTLWGWFAALGFLGVALWNNWVLLHYATAMPRWTVGAANACLVLLGAWLLRPQVFRLFHARGLHWWRAAPRYPVCARVELVTADGARVEGSVFNLSRTGLFAEIPGPGVETGTVVQVRVHLEDRVLSCRARVVRRAPATPTYPEGLGLRFTAVPFFGRVWLSLGLSSETPHLTRPRLGP